jgi:hypothetical protein
VSRSCPSTASSTCTTCPSHVAEGRHRAAEGEQFPLDRERAGQRLHLHATARHAGGIGGDEHEPLVALELGPHVRRQRILLRKHVQAELLAQPRRLALVRGFDIHTQTSVSGSASTSETRSNGIDSCER